MSGTAAAFLAYTKAMEKKAKGFRSRFAEEENKEEVKAASVEEIGYDSDDGKPEHFGGF